MTPNSDPSQNAVTIGFLRSGFNLQPRNRLQGFNLDTYALLCPKTAWQSALPAVVSLTWRLNDAMSFSCLKIYQAVSGKNSPWFSAENSHICSSILSRLHSQLNISLSMNNVLSHKHILSSSPFQWWNISLSAQTPTNALQRRLTSSRYFSRISL